MAIVAVAALSIPVAKRKLLNSIPGSLVIKSIQTINPSNPIEITLNSVPISFRIKMDCDLADSIFKIKKRICNHQIGQDVRKYSGD